MQLASWIAQLAWLAAVEVVTTDAAPLAADGKVHELTTATFDAAIKAHTLSFVEFFAPWCGHCKKLVPEWEKTAKLTQASGVPVATVDAIAEKKLAEKHKVQSFPTLKLYRGDPDVVKKYEGPRTADKMVEWLEIWKAGPILDGSVAQNAGVQEVNQWRFKVSSVSILGLRSGNEPADKAMLDVLTSASFALNGQKPNSDVPVAVTTMNSASITELNVPSDGQPTTKIPSVLLFRNFDFESKLVSYRPSSDMAWQAKNAYQEFIKWFDEHRLPSLIPGNEATEKFFLQDIDVGKGLLLYLGDSEEAARSVHKLAVKFSSTEKRLKWVHVKSDEFGVSLAKSVGVEKNDFPDVAIWEFGESEDDDKVYRLSQQEGGTAISESSVEKLVTQWQAGELSAEKDPVVSVTTNDFEKIVFDKSRDVLVEFYAPWCGHCKALAPEYKKLAKQYEKDKGIKIVKMDATKHKHESAKITGYPTLKFYVAGKKTEPIDPGFKAGRDQKSLATFIEENRVTTPKGKTKKPKSEKKDADTSTTTTAKPRPSDGMPPPEKQKSSGEPWAAAVGEVPGSWIFDDAADPTSRGSSLTPDMVNSRNGYTLVHVGQMGLLVTPADVTRVVRSFATPVEAANYAKQVQQLLRTDSEVSAKDKTQLGTLPCPENADMTACQAWCEGVSGEQSFQATLGGKTCEELGANAKPNDVPQCMCYDDAFTDLYAMCKSKCSTKGGTGKCNANDKTCLAQKPSKATQVVSEDRTVATSPSVPSATKTRYFLYDVKYGEGFNLQREVYPRAGWIVAELNKEIKKRCGSKTTGADCTRWTLVLPPWCRVVHWWSGPEHMPWGTFFDMEALRKAKVPIIEFSDYVKIMGSQSVDLVAWYATERKEMKDGVVLSGGKAEFEGWAESVEDCVGKQQHRKLPEHTKDKSGDYKFVYAGQCQGGIRTKVFRCGAIKGPWPVGIVDMLSSLDANVGSVLVKGYDYLLSPDNDQLDALGLRDSMFWSKELRTYGDDFIKSAFKGRPYLAAHCRRTDFLRVRTKTVPTADTIADKLNSVLAETGFDQVFVATDAPGDLREDLKAKVKGSVHFYDAESDAHSFELPGQQAAVEMWIASRADFFIGSIESRFTMWIQLERGFLGKPQKTSEQEFCKVNSDAKKNCIAPKHRWPASKGAHRDAYFA